VHDFLIKELGRAVPYGVYDLAANAGWVSIGIDALAGTRPGSATKIVSAGRHGPYPRQER